MPTASGKFKGISLSGLHISWKKDKDEVDEKPVTRRRAKRGGKIVEVNTAPERETR